MPPEPLPWDRKELRKYDNGGGVGSAGGGGGGGFGGPRWREPPFPHHHPYNNHYYHNNHHGGGSRWVPDFRYRPPPGHGRQGGRHLYPDDLGHGLSAPRPNDKLVDDESCRPSGSARYGRGSRENRGSFGQKDWKGYSSESSSLSNGPGRPNNLNDHRSLDNVQPNSSVPSSDLTSRDQSQFKDQHDIGGSIGVAGNTGKILERENSVNSIEWQPLKWTRSSSLSSRGSGFSHSSSSKNMVPESEEMKGKLILKNEKHASLADVDAAACVSSDVPSEERNSRKKPRLGWGEGLAKYEKKKVEVADDSTIKNGATVCGNSEPAPCHFSNFTEKSRVLGLSDCASPATPSSVACSSSPGVEEKLIVKASDVDHESANLCSSPSGLAQNHWAGSTFNLENLDLTSVSHLNTSINELLQTDDPCTLDSGFVRSSAMNKLLLLKNDISKVLEATESEIDLLENELKSLISERESNYACLAASSSVPAECDSKPCEDRSAASTIRPPALQLDPSGCLVVEDADNAPDDDYVPPKDEDVDSPGSATSKFVHISSSLKDVSPPVVLKDVESFMDPVVSNSGNLEVECSIDDRSEEKVASSFGTNSGDVSLQAGREEIFFAPLLASNRDYANGVSEELKMLLPIREDLFDISSSAVVSLSENKLVKRRFLKKKCFRLLKERIITLKFKMFRHIWKEEAQLSLKKLRAKSNKRFDFSLRIVNSGCQKYRSSIRSRYSLTTASLSLESTTEIVNHASKLLSEPQGKVFRNVLKMPAMILDKQERMVSRFFSTNGLVEDPCAVEKERSLINPWLSEEKEIFLEKLTAFGKDFRKIASFLNHKTTADCVEFYYKNHKSDSFEKTKKKPDFAKRAKFYSANTYLVGSGKRWSREANAVSLDLLGAASAIASGVDCMKTEQNYALKSFHPVSNSSRTPRGLDGLVERSTSLDLYNDERETVAADVLAGICGSLSSEAMSSCITSSVDPGESYQEWKYQRVGTSTRRPLTPEVTQNVDDETCSDESCGDMDPTDWTDEEKALFIQAVSTCGRDFAMISRYVRTRSKDQCKVFFSKGRKCLGLDLICPAPGNLGIDDGNDGGSDTEDACTVETGSVICSEKLGSETGLDNPPSHIKLKHDLVDIGINNVKSDLNKMEEGNEAGDMGSTDTLLRSKNLVPAECLREDKPEVGFDVIEDGALEASQGVGAANDHNLSNMQGNEIQGRVANASYLKNPKAKFEGEEFLLHKSNSSGVRVGTCLSDKNGVSCSLQDEQSEAHLARTNSMLTAGTSSSGLHLKTDLELDSTQKPHDIAPPKSNCSFPLDVKLKLSSKTKHGKSSGNDSSVLGSEEFSDKHRVDSSEINEQHLSGNSTVKHLESSHILCGYPVPVSTLREMAGDVSCKKSIMLHGGGQSDWISFGRYSVRDSFLQKCNSSKPVNSGAQLALPSQGQSRGCCTSTPSSQGDKPCSNGNVKLFGQILSKPSPHKPSLSARRNEDNSAHLHFIDSKSSKMQCSTCETVDGPSAPTRYAHNNFGISEKCAQNSSNFWDRNRVPNGFSSTSESALLLAKYPSAFGAYAMASAKMDQRPLHGVGKNGECSLNSVSVFPTRDIGDSNGLADFQVYADKEAEPFTIDVRQHDILLSEMQRRNRLDVVSGIQQQSNGLVGINIVGRGGVLVGGQCTSVSDPVAAIRLQYAKAEQFSRQTGNMIRDDDSWRGKANVGR